MFQKNVLLINGLSKKEDMDIENIATLNKSNHSRIQDLNTQFVVNIAEIQKLQENINKIEDNETNAETLEELYEKEFMLFMTHIGIFEDLVNSIDKEPKVLQNQFELARIKKFAEQNVLVDVLEL